MRELLGARELLQQACTPCPACPTPQLAGVATGGWIAVAALAGCLLGVLATLSVQCLSRHSKARSQAYALRLAEVSELKSGTGNTPPHQQGPHMQQSASRLGAGCQPPPSFSPLTARASQGGMPQAGSKLGPSNSSARVLVVHEAGDVGQGDQAMAPAAHQQPGRPLEGPASYRSAEELDSMCLSTESSSVPVMSARAAAAAATATVPAGGSPVRRNAGNMEQVLNPMYEQAPTPGGGPYRAAQGSVLPLVQAARTPSPRPAAAGVPAPAAAATAVAPSAARGGAGAGAAAAAPTGSRAASRPTTAAQSELEDEYEVDDLDDDWRWLLQDLDKRLTRQSRPTMDARERAVAIKKLLVATGTRGVDFAMGAAMEEVLRFRQAHGRR